MVQLRREVGWCSLIGRAYETFYPLLGAGFLCFHRNEAPQLPQPDELPSMIFNKRANGCVPALTAMLSIWLPVALCEMLAALLS